MDRRERILEFLRANCLLLLTLLGAFLVLCWPFLRGQIYASFDFAEMAIPDRAFYSLCLQHGDNSHWTPFYWRGLDHAGYGETGMFHPVRVLYRFLPLTLALCIEMVMHFPISLAGAYLYLRRRHGVDSSSALFGASVFAFSIFPLAHFGQMHMCLIFSHLPWMVLFAWGAMTGRRPWLSAAGTGLCLGSMLLLCHPQTAFIVCIPVGLVIAYELVRQRDRHCLGRAGLLAPALVGGLMVGMVQLLPTLTALGEAERGALSQAQRCGFSLHPLHLLPNLLPGIYGRKGLGDVVTFLDGSQDYLLNPTEFCAYFGIGMLTFLFGCLIICRISVRKHRLPIVFISVSAVVAVLLMLGGYGGLHRWLIHAPFIADFRSPNRYKVVLTTFLGLGAALGMYTLRHTPLRPCPPARQLLLFAPACLSLITAVLVLAVGTFSFRGHLMNPRAVVGLVWGVGVSGAIGALLLLWWRQRPKWVLPLVTCICFLDVCVVGLEVAVKVPRKSMADIQRLHRQLRPGERQGRVIAPSNFPLWDGQYMATGYLGMKPTALIPYTDTRMLQLASVARGYKDPETSRRVPDPVLPRFRLVPNLRRQPGAVDWQNLPDPTQTALTTTPHELQGPPVTPEETVQVLEERYSRVTLEVVTGTERLLVCSDRWAPGWRAIRGGRELPMVPLYDHAMRGIPVPRGRHTIVMDYVSPAVTRGTRWTWAGLALLAALAVGQIFAERFSVQPHNLADEGLNVGQRPDASQTAHVQDQHAGGEEDAAGEGPEEAPQGEDPI